MASARAVTELIRVAGRVVWPCGALIASACTLPLVPAPMAVATALAPAVSLPPASAVAVDVTVPPIASARFVAAPPAE